MGVAPVTFRNGLVGNRLYIHKQADGQQVRNHSVLTHPGAKAGKSVELAALKKLITIHDDNVLQEYHAILIPKAIEYSAGILDYFFRGQLELSVSLQNGQYQLHITNRSGQALSGGAFGLYQDDAAGNRTSVPLTLPSTGTSTLADGADIDGTFAGTFAANAAFLLVYQGTIGTNGGSPPAALDSVDAGIAIAARKFQLPPPAIRYRFSRLSKALPPWTVIESDPNHNRSTQEQLVALSRRFLTRNVTDSAGRSYSDRCSWPGLDLTGGESADIVSFYGLPGPWGVFIGGPISGFFTFGNLSDDPVITETSISGTSFGVGVSESRSDELDLVAQTATYQAFLLGRDFAELWDGGFDEYITFNEYCGGAVVGCWNLPNTQQNFYPLGHDLGLGPGWWDPASANTSGHDGSPIYDQLALVDPTTPPLLPVTVPASKTVGGQYYVERCQVQFPTAPYSYCIVETGGADASGKFPAWVLVESAGTTPGEIVELPMPRNTGFGLGAPIGAVGTYDLQSGSVFMVIGQTAAQFLSANPQYVRVN